MRRRWPVLLATIPLIFGWVLVAAYPAAASASPAVAGAGRWQPGGPISNPGNPTMVERHNRMQTVVTSENWAGYVATGATGKFTSVSASWVQPAATCTSGDQYSAFWVGLDGYTSSTVEQTGSAADCTGKTASYYAWWEIYPAAETEISEPVAPGDTFTASVNYTGGEYVLTIADTTHPWSFTITQPESAAKRSSAEVIAEAPCCTSRGGILPLTNFGTVDFASALVNGSALAGYTPVEIKMRDTTITAITPSGADGEAFGVTYSAVASPARFFFGRGAF